MARKRAAATTVEALLEAQEGEFLPLPKYRANENLAFSDLIVEDFPEAVGQVFARQGEITALYSHLRALPDRIQFLVELGVITPMSEE